MNRQILYVVGMTVLVALVANAQDENSTLKKELTQAQAQGYANSNSANTVSQPAAPVIRQQSLPPATVVQQPVAQPTSQSGPIYIIEKQPTTVVEDTQLKESKADQLRKSREEVERNTEERIVEKLEADRVKAEQERAQRVSDAFDKKDAPVVPPPAPVAPAPVAQPVYTPIVVAPHVVEAQEVREELKKPEPVVAKEPFYITPRAGFTAYPSVSNLNGGFSAGVGVGKVFDNNLTFELAFLYTKFDITSVGTSPYQDPYSGLYVPFISQMVQYNWTAGMKYLFSNDTVFSPYVGSDLSYTRRSYSVNNSGRGYYYWDNAATSGALDLGLGGGVSVELAKKFRVGVDFKYFWDLTYSLDSQYQRAQLFQPLDQKIVEQLSYYQFLLTGALLF